LYSLAEIVAMDVDAKIRGVVTQLKSTSSSITSQSMAINDKKVTVPQFDRRMYDFVNTTELIMCAPLILESEKMIGRLTLFKSRGGLMKPY
jgi:hypothetical protein